MLGVAKVAVEAEEVTREAKDTSLHFVTGVALDFPGKFFQRFERKLFRRNLLDNALNLFQLVAGDERAAKLLEVQRRAVFRDDRADFVARQNMVEHFVLFEAVEQPGQKLRAKSCRFLRARLCVEEPLRVFFFVEIAAEPGGFVLAKEIQLLTSFIYLRANLLQFVLLMLYAELDVVQGSFQVAGIIGA